MMITMMPMMIVMVWSRHKSLVIVIMSMSILVNE
jgi:hypothetical protein